MQYKLFQCYNNENHKQLMNAFGSDDLLTFSNGKIIGIKYCPEKYLAMMEKVNAKLFRQHIMTQSKFVNLVKYSNKLDIKLKDIDFSESINEEYEEHLKNLLLNNCTQELIKLLRELEQYGINVKKVVVVVNDEQRILRLDILKNGVVTCYEQDKTVLSDNIRKLLNFLVYGTGGLNN